MAPMGPTPTMVEMETYSLPPLPYDPSGLEPWIDAPTMRAHHGYHHRRCVQALNDTEARLLAARAGGDHLLLQALQDRAVALLSAHRLHQLFWDSMGREHHTPCGDLADQLREDFGSFTAFKFCFSAAAASLDGSGWAVLAWHRGRERLVIQSDEGNRLPASAEIVHLMALDVWEHAYYLKYQHRRAEYVHNWWNTVDWQRVARRFELLADGGPADPQMRSTARCRDDTRTIEKGAVPPSPPQHLVLVR